VVIEMALYGFHKHCSQTIRHGENPHETIHYIVTGSLRVTAHHKVKRPNDASFCSYCVDSMPVSVLVCQPTDRLSHIIKYKKAQLSLTNPRDAKACQKLLRFDVLTTLSLTTLAYLHSFSCCCVRNLRNHEKFTENSNL